MLTRLCPLFCLLLMTSYAQASEFLDSITGNFYLRKTVSSTTELGLKRTTKDCPINLHIKFDEPKSSLQLTNRGSGKMVEVFPSINLSKKVDKVDNLIWQETKTTLKRTVLTKRSRLCKGAVSRNCEGNYKPQTSLFSSKKDLVYSIYGKNHHLIAKCYYQRPNEIGL